MAHVLQIKVLDPVPELRALDQAWGTHHIGSTYM